jgi:hypothetical protein
VPSVGRSDPSTFAQPVTGAPGVGNTTGSEDLGQPPLVVAVRWHGANFMTVTYRDDHGAVEQAMVGRDDEPRLRLGTRGRSHALDGDAESWRLAAEALRIKYAAPFDPMLAVTTSDLEPLPHQIRAGYGELLPRTPLRYLLADDPGAGKTIMAGLYVKELMLRGDLARCLVVASRQPRRAVAGRAARAVRAALRGPGPGHDRHQPGRECPRPRTPC